MEDGKVRGVRIGYSRLKFGGGMALIADEF
jgi:hypothetical protein